MKMPGFTAEASVYRTSNTYRVGYVTLAGNASAGVIPQQRTPARIFAREPERNGRGQFGVEVGGPASVMEDCLYGRWCGPGCGSGNPIDNLDECCMAHDMCYTERGFGACSCDLELVGCAFPKQFEFWRPLKAIAAGAIVGLFTARLSSGVCLPERGAGGGGGTPPSRPPNCSVDLCPPFGELRCCGGLVCRNGRCVPTTNGYTP